MHFCVIGAPLYGGLADMVPDQSGGLCFIKIDIVPFGEATDGDNFCCRLA